MGFLPVSLFAWKILRSPAGGRIKRIRGRRDRNDEELASHSLEYRNGNKNQDSKGSLRRPRGKGKLQRNKEENGRQDCVRKLVIAHQMANKSVRIKVILAAYPRQRPGKGRIRIAGTIALNPRPRPFANSREVMIFRGI